MNIYYLNSKLISFFCINLLCLFLLNSNAKNIDTPYEFRVIPGTQDWANLKTESERLDACQIPQEILNNMTTRALALTCLNYPLFWDMSAFNSYQKGFSILSDRFNGLRELKKRKDAGYQLYNIYKDKFADISSIGLSEIELGNLRLVYMETILTQDEILKNMNAYNRKKLLKESLKKYETKKRNSKKFSNNDLMTSCLIFGRILKLQQNTMTNVNILKDNDTKLFLKSGVTSNLEMMEKLAILAGRE